MNSKQIAIFLFSLFLFSCQNKETTLPKEKEKACLITPELKPKLSFDTVRIQNITLELELTGNVSYDQDRIFRFQSLFSGIVQKINFNLGDFVQKGQILAEVKSIELSEQRNQLFLAQSALKIANRNLKSIDNMHESGLASDSELLEAEKEVKNAQSEINKIMESASIQGGNIEKGIYLIKAAQSGYIVQKNITVGSQINENNGDLFAISDLKKVWIMTNVYAAQLDLVKQNESVTVHTTAYPDRTFKGKISRLSNVFDPEEKVMKAIIEMENADLALKPDMMVLVKILKDYKQDALAIPADTVIFDNDAFHVLVYKNDCEVEKRKIDPIEHNKHFYYLSPDSDLISENDVLISKNNLLLYHQLSSSE